MNTPKPKAFHPDEAHVPSRTGQLHRTEFTHFPSGDDSIATAVETSRDAGERIYLENVSYDNLKRAAKTQRIAIPTPEDANKNTLPPSAQPWLLARGEKRQDIAGGRPEIEMRTSKNSAVFEAKVWPGVKVHFVEEHEVREEGKPEGAAYVLLTDLKELQHKEEKALQKEGIKATFVGFAGDVPEANAKVDARLADKGLPPMEGVAMGSYMHLYAVTEKTQAKDGAVQLKTDIRDRTGAQYTLGDDGKIYAGGNKDFGASGRLLRLSNYTQPTTPEEAKERGMAGIQFMAKAVERQAKTLVNEENARLVGFMQRAETAPHAQADAPVIKADARPILAINGTLQNTDGDTFKMGRDGTFRANGDKSGAGSYLFSVEERKAPVPVAERDLRVTPVHVPGTHVELAPAASAALKLGLTHAMLAEDGVKAIHDEAERLQFAELSKFAKDSEAYNALLAVKNQLRALENPAKRSSSPMDAANDTPQSGAETPESAAVAPKSWLKRRVPGFGVTGGEVALMAATAATAAGFGLPYVARNIGPKPVAAKRAGAGASGSPADIATQSILLSKGLMELAKDPHAVEIAESKTKLKDYLETHHLENDWAALAKVDGHVQLFTPHRDLTMISLMEALERKKQELYAEQERLGENGHAHEEQLPSIILADGSTADGAAHTRLFEFQNLIRVYAGQKSAPAFKNAHLKEAFGELPDTVASLPPQEGGKIVRDNVRRVDFTESLTGKNSHRFAQEQASSTVESQGSGIRAVILPQALIDLAQEKDSHKIWESDDKLKAELEKRGMQKTWCAVVSSVPGTADYEGMPVHIQMLVPDALIGESSRVGSLKEFRDIMALVADPKKQPPAYFAETQFKRLDGEEARKPANDVGALLDHEIKYTANYIDNLKNIEDPRANAPTPTLEEPAVLSSHKDNALEK